MIHLLKREFLLCSRRKGYWLSILGFFVLIAAMVPLATGAEENRIRAIGAGVVWVSALLASLLALPKLYVPDFEDGSLEQMVLSVFPLHSIVFCKVLVHWLTTGLPVAAIGPILGLQYDLGLDASMLLGATLLLGTPTLSFIGSTGAALSLGLRGAGALQGVLLLPMYAPVLVFGGGAVLVLSEGGDPAPLVYLLCALSCLSIVLGTWATCAALRLALD